MLLQVYFLNEHKLNFCQNLSWILKRTIFIHFQVFNLFVQNILLFDPSIPRSLPKM